MTRFCRIMTIAGLASFFIATALTGAFARTKKDYIMVLDTSYSMSGQGGKNIIAGVKARLGEYIDKIEKGDTLTFVTFADDVTFYPTVLIEDKNDRDIVKKYMSVVDAKGMWTYTHEMVRQILQKASDLQNADKSRQIVIVIMTDTLDDPPPSKKKQRTSLKELLKGYQGNDWFVYLVSFSDLQKSDAFKSIAGEFSSALPGTKVINSNDPASGINQMDAALKADEAKKRRDSFIRTLIIVVCVVLLLVILAALWRFLYTKYLSYTLTGYLDYRYKHSPYKDYDTADLGRIGEKRIEIGNGAQFRVNIRDFAGKTPVVLQAARFDKVIRPVVLESVSAPVEFLNGKNTSFLSDGDSFTSGDCIFVYRERQ